MDKFFDFIDSQRAKPEGSRQRMAFFSSLGLTILVGAIWLGAFNPFSFSSSAVAAADKPAPPPLATLFELGRDFTKQVSSVLFAQ